MLADEDVFERTHAGFVKATFAGHMVVLSWMSYSKPHSSQWVVLLNLQLRPLQPYFGRMLLSMRRLLAGVSEPKVESSAATIGFFFGRETFLIMPLKIFFIGAKIVKGEMLG